jgi:polysaccharide biosynthesis protein PslH
MRVLFGVPYVPTLIRTRPFNFVRGLVKRGNAVTLATLWENEEERESLREFERMGVEVIAARLTKPRSLWNSALALPTPDPLQSVYCWVPALLPLLRARLAQSTFDVIHVEHLRGARYGLWLKSQIAGLGKTTPVVWDSVDCISYLFAQASRQSQSLFGKWVTRLELGRTRYYEGWLIHQFDRVLVTSPKDQMALVELAGKHNQGNELPRGDINVLPNGVDLEYFQPRDDIRALKKIVLSGKMSYHANTTAALYLVNEIMPRVWGECPEAQVTIVGKNPPPQVLDLALRYAQRVCVTGTVSDIRPYLAQATLAVSSVQYGAGIQNKVLEAMAMGTPVVATPQAVSALQVVDGEHVLVGESPESFARAVVCLLREPEQCARLGQAGLNYVIKNHAWNFIVEHLEQAYMKSITESKNETA